MPCAIEKYKFSFRFFSSATRKSLSALGAGFAKGFYVGLICVGGIYSVNANAADGIARAEAWFNKIKTIKADFVQIASDGTSSEGNLLFRRPSQMKIIYRNDGGGNGMQLITVKFGFILTGQRKTRNQLPIIGNTAIINFG